MNWLILILMATALSASMLVFFLLRTEPATHRPHMLDGDHYEVDEMLAAFGKNQDWV